MRETAEKARVERTFTAFVCDRCKKRATPDDFVEWQEFQLFGGTGGYGSAFGDGNHWHADLCMGCAKLILGPYLWYSDEDGKPVNGT